MFAVELDDSLLIYQAESDYLTRDETLLVTKQFEGIFPAAGYSYFIVDLRGVKAFSSSFVGFLLLARQKCADVKCKIVLCNIEKHAMDTLKTMCLAKLFTIVPDRQAARSVMGI